MVNPSVILVIGSLVALLGVSMAIVGVRLVRQNRQQRQRNSQLQSQVEDMGRRMLERTAELQAAKDRTDAILCSVPDPLFVLDEDRQVVMANELGEGLMEAARHAQVDLFAENRLMGGLSANDLLEVGGRTYQGVASLLEGGQAWRGMVVVFRDVTRFHEVDQMKTQFLSDVSHELRTPLANLTLYLDLLGTIDDPERRQGYLDTLHRETRRLTYLIQDMLAISRLEAGRLQVTLGPVDAGRLLADLAHDRRMMALGQGLTLIYEPPGEALFALADAVLLNQCLSNLVTNAINYTPPGGSVWLRVGPEAGSPSWLALSVCDNGVGILPEEQQLIFSRFYRGSASRQTNAPGTGLGLSISKEIIERMGGAITVQSTPGQGSTFTIRLQAANDPSRTRAL